MVGRHNGTSTIVSLPLFCAPPSPNQPWGVGGGQLILHSSPTRPFLWAECDSAHRGPLYDSTSSSVLIIFFCLAEHLVVILYTGTVSSPWQGLDRILSSPLKKKNLLQKKSWSKFKWSPNFSSVTNDHLATPRGLGKPAIRYVKCWWACSFAVQSCTCLLSSKTCCVQWGLLQV